MINSIDPVLAPIADDSAQTMTRLRDQLAAAAKRTSCWTLPIGQWIHLSAHCSSRPPIKDWSGSRTRARTMIMSYRPFRS